MKNDLLPVGSVLTLKGSPSKIMVAGYGPIDNEKKWYFEYLGVGYPGGCGDKNDTVMFDGNMIETIIFYGYSDEESVTVCNALGKMIRK